MINYTRKRILPFIAAVFLWLFSHAQQDNKRFIDSLYRLMQAEHKEDTNYAKLLNNYSRVIRFDSVDKALFYAQEATMLAKKLKEEYWVGQGFSSLAFVYYNIGKLQLAIYYLDSAAIFFEKQNKYTALLVSLGMKGAIFRTLGKYAEAVDAHHQVIVLSDKISDIGHSAAAYSDIGVIFSDLSMHSEAILNYQKALEKLSKTHDTLMIGLCHQNLGYSYYKLKNYVQSKLEFDTAIMLYYSISRFDAVAWIKGGLALTLAYLREYNVALTIIKESIRQAVERKNKRALGLCNINAAKIIALATDSIHSREFSYQNALRYASDGFEQLKEIGDTKSQVFAMEVLSEIYHELSDDRLAYEFQKRYMLLNDSIAGGNKIQEVAIKDLKFENEKKKAILDAQHAAELERQKTIRNFLIIGAVLVMLVSLLVFYFYKRHRDAKAKQQKAELQAEIADIEMKVMRLQMNPHFIFNSLNSISDYIRRNNPDEADEYLSKFAKVMRMTLENSERQAISLEDDLKALELYMQLEAKRLDNKFTYEIRVADDVDKEHTLVPPMIFQPFVENSIWHGIAKKDGKGHIVVDVRKEGELLHCFVDDDGIGREKTLMGKETLIVEKQPMGMKITNARIDLLNRLKGGNASILLKDKVGGVTAELRLPLETAF